MTTITMLEDVNEARSISFEEWLDVPRFAEYAAFQLELGIYMSSIVWEIVEQRWPDARREFQTQVLFLRQVYSTHQHFALRYKGLTRQMHVDLTARKLGLTVREVYAVLEEAKLLGVPDLMATSA